VAGTLKILRQRLLLALNKIAYVEVTGLSAVVEKSRPLHRH
jgi:hypothetical protein